MLPHALSLGKGFLSSICSQNARFEMFVWILNGFCGMGYRHIQKKTWILWHTIQSRHPLWIWHPLWIVFDIAETVCWYEHLVMMFRHVCKWLYISSRQRHYTSLQVLYRDTGIVIATIAMPRTEILWTLVKMFSIHFRKSVMAIQIDFEWKKFWCSVCGV